MKNRYNLLLEKQKKLTESDVEVLIVYEALKDLGAKNLRKYKNLIQNINGFQNTE